MMSDDEVRQMIAEQTAELRVNPPALEDLSTDEQTYLAALWQDDAHQAYSESVFAARAGDLDEARRLYAEAAWSEQMSRKVHGLIWGT